MSTFLYQNLENGVALSQNFKLTHGKMIHAVRVKLFRHGLLTDGTLNVKIKDSSDTLATQTSGFSDLNAVTGDAFVYGFFSFLFNYRLGGRKTNEDGHEYTLELSMTGHTDSDSIFLGWIRDDYENPVQSIYGDDQTDGVANSDYNHPFAYEIIETI